VRLVLQGADCQLIEEQNYARLPGMHLDEIGTRPEKDIGQNDLFQKEYCRKSSEKHISDGPTPE